MIQTLLSYFKCSISFVVLSIAAVKSLPSHALSHSPSHALLLLQSHAPSPSPSFTLSWTFAFPCHFFIVMHHCFTGVHLHFHRRTLLLSPHCPTLLLSPPCTILNFHLHCRAPSYTFASTASSYTFGCFTAPSYTFAFTAPSHCCTLLLDLNSQPSHAMPLHMMAFAQLPATIHKPTAIHKLDSHQASSSWQQLWSSWTMSSTTLLDLDNTAQARHFYSLCMILTTIH